MYVYSYYVAHNASFQGDDFLTACKIRCNQFWFPPPFPRPSKYCILDPSDDYFFFLLFSPSLATFSGWGINKGREVVLRCKEPSNCFGRLLAKSLQIRRLACCRELLWNNRLGTCIVKIYFSFLLSKYEMLYEEWSFSEVFASSLVFANLSSLHIFPKTNGDFCSKA